MSAKNLFRIEYQLLSLKDTYGEWVSSDYHLGIPPEYWVDGNIDFYFDENKFFSEQSFSIFKFVLDASHWFMTGFPNSEFIWNEDEFDGWSGKISISSTDSQVLFQVDFEQEKTLIPIDSFETGFAKFINEFEESVESFYGMGFNMI